MRRSAILPHLLPMPHQPPCQPHGHGMTLNQLFLPIQKTLNICPASRPIIAAVAGSRRTNQMPLAFPIYPANQSPTGQARAPHQFFRGHGPVFADRASLFENLKNVQNKLPLSCRKRHNRRPCEIYVTVFTDGSFLCKMQTGNVRAIGFACQPLPGRHTREAAFFRV